MVEAVFYNAYARGIFETFRVWGMHMIIWSIHFVDIICSFKCQNAHAFELKIVSKSNLAKPSIFLTGKNKKIKKIEQIEPNRHQIYLNNVILCVEEFFYDAQMQH